MIFHIPQKGLPIEAPYWKHNHWGKMSSQFGVVNGIKQGGVWSPLLFAMLMKLEETGVGCHLGIRFIRTFAFPDDLNMLAPILTGLKILIDVWKICQWVQY